MLPVVSFCLCLCVIVIHARPQHATIQHPIATKPFLSVVSSYSTQLDSNDLKGAIQFHETDPQGCSIWPTTDDSQSTSFIAIVDRGTCTFFEKTRNAQTAGAKALIVISDDESLDAMSADDNNIDNYPYPQIIVTLMAQQSLKKYLKSQPFKTSFDQIISIEIYEPSGIYDPAMIVMCFVSTLLVGMGAYYSSDIERAAYYGISKTNRRTTPTQEIDSTMAWSFILVASFGLLTMYFFLEYLFMFVVVIFMCGGTNGLRTILSHLIEHFFPKTELISYYMKQVDMTLTLSDVLALIPAATTAITWYVYRQTESAWILQNTLCLGLLMVLQRSVSLPNLKISSILLITAFFYDIFWVFVSPMFFEKSVMVKVATYSHKGSPRDTLPVVLKFPRITDIFHSPMILGLGDIALPGLFVSYLLRFDYMSKNIGFCNMNGFFWPSLIGYFIGMCLTDMNLILMEKGQPALLFLVPCTLGTTAYLAWKRGSFKQLWNGNKMSNGGNYSLISHK